jgi:hypothetical protein
MCPWRTWWAVAVCFGTLCPTTEASDFEVINTLDGGYGSLRQAIFDANDNPGSDRILFNIPGSGVRSIRLQSGLPEITEPLEIDGYSQPGAMVNTLSNGFNAVLLIQLDGGGNSPGLALNGGMSSVRGLILNRLVVALRLASSSNVVSGNLIGPDPGGINALGNTEGVVTVNDCCNVVGGLNPADRNVIGGNGGNGLEVNSSTNLLVQGNFFGTDITGLRPLPRNPGSSTLSVRECENFVLGGFEPGAANVIAVGFIGLHLYPGSNVDIRGNSIGVGADGQTPLKNTNNTVAILAGGYARIERNAIAYSSTGVQVTGIRSTILGNRIYSNDVSGILLGFAAQANDAGDLDSGPNDLQNYPTFEASFADDDLLLTGELSSKPNMTYRVEFFASAARNTNGSVQGEVLLGSRELTTTSAGIASFIQHFPFPDPRFSWITATATDADGNTSAFSTGAQARSSGLPYVHQHPVSVTVTNGVTVAFQCDVSGAEPITYQWRWNDLYLPDATNKVLVLTNVLPSQQGTYQLIASNSLGFAVSLPAALSIIAGPMFVVHPISQVVAPGEWVTVSAALSEFTTAPIGFRWRSNGVFVTHSAGSEYNSFFAFRAGTTPVNLAVLVTNIVSRTGVISVTAAISVTSDRDQDGLPDTYESQAGLDPDNPADAVSDADLDGASAAQEYAAGTNPLDGQSQFKIDRFFFTLSGTRNLTFTMISNRTYRVEYRNQLEGGLWQLLQGVPARRTNGPVTIQDRTPASGRFYRLVTPYLAPPP